MTVTMAWLYGVLAIASIFITVAMARMGWERLCERQRRNSTVPLPRPDLYFMVVFFAGLHGLGGAIWWVLRAWDAVINGQLNAGSVPTLIVISALLYAVGKGGLVFASAVNGKPLIWRLFLGFCALWSALVWWDFFR